MNLMITRIVTMTRASVVVTRHADFMGASVNGRHMRCDTHWRDARQFFTLCPHALSAIKLIYMHRHA